MGLMVTAISAGGVAAPAIAADTRPCPTARKALERTYTAADAVAQASNNAVMSLMPAALTAEQASDEAHLANWPDAVVAIFIGIAGETRALAADPAKRTPAAAKTLREHAQSGEAEVGTICGP